MKLVYFMMLFVFEIFPRSSFGESISCRRSISYDQLCPSPIQKPPMDRHSASESSFQQFDVFISLSQYEENATRTPACNFYKSKALLAGVHMTDEPWDFSFSNQCSHNVKFFQDSEDKKPAIAKCRQEIGMRLSKQTEDTASYVYFWHNFTFTQDHIVFSDQITNFDFSDYDISCSKHPRYVQIVILTSVYTECTLLVQQYEFDHSDKGCDNMHSPHPSFCGIYRCSEQNNIIVKMKVQSRNMNIIPILPGKSDNEDHDTDNSTDHLISPVDETSMKEWIVTAGFPIGGLILTIIGLICLRKQSTGPNPKDSELSQDDIPDSNSIASIEKEGFPL